jgi:hypothetical protein
MIKDNQMNAIKKIALVFAVSCMSLAISCTNINQSASSVNTSNIAGIVANSTSTVFSHTLQAFSYVASTGSTSSTASLTLTLTVNTSATGFQPLTGFCGTGTSNPCACEMVWSQLNTVNNIAYNYDRTKRVAVTNVQAGAVNCLLDETTWNEIPDATVISFRIVPLNNNATGLNTSTLNWKKGTSVSAAGDFLDDTLTPFRNIMRYTCFSKSTGARAYEIVNNFSTASSSGSTSTTPYNIIMGSQYCIGSALGTSTTSNGATTNSTCPNPRNGYTAQSYYRNFFVRSDQIGNINSTNDTYDCPKVLEGIQYSAGQTIPSAASGQYWPLDTSFSLATTNSSEWSVGVPATTNLFKAGDANSVQTLCADESVTTTNTDGTTTTTASTNRLVDGKVVITCLGYAKKPNTDGTCGSIKDSNGLVHLLTRLRRFRVMYPPMFDATGAVFTTNPFADEVYIADRLAVDSTGKATGNMIYGPKPCNFSWFDHEGATKRDGTTQFYSGLLGDKVGVTQRYATPGYRATSDYQYIEDRDGAVGDANYHAHKWSVDPDGLVLPNVDHDGTVTNAQNYASCSATLPWVDWTNGTPTDMRLLTTNINRADKVTLGTRSIYLREIANQTVDPWTPNYVEDTSFNACVPLPTTYVDPPLHFYKQDNNTMGWCAEVYPTQNPYWYDLNKARKPQNGSASIVANVVNYPSAAIPAGTPNVALVKIYTSHDTSAVGNSSVLDATYNTNCTGTLSSPICSMTGFLNGTDPTYCNAFLARANKTCDRTVMFSSTQQYLDFPLLASDDDINSMISTDLSHDRNFSCQYSVNADPSKVGAKIPSSGCCGVVGGSPQVLLKNLQNGHGAHLEPYLDPTSTNTSSRYCGSPVE